MSSHPGAGLLGTSGSPGSPLAGTARDPRLMALVRPVLSRWCRSGPASAFLLGLGINLGAVVALGVARFAADVSAPGGLATWAGRMTGLIAEVLVLALVLLAARAPLLERALGQDRLLRWHRWLAPSALVVVAAHPMLLALGYAGGSGGWFGRLLSLGSTTLDAVVGTVLFFVAGISSVRLVRRHLPYESWHLLHLVTYAAVLLAFAHQLSIGSQVLQGTWVRLWWTTQLVAVLVTAAVYRVVLPLLRSARHDLRVVQVRRESPDTVSVRVRGKNLHRLGAHGGQFLVWRFLDARHWWRAHPFSLSAAPSSDGLRLTAREVGDGTRALASLRPGTRLLVEGPYGVLHAATRRRERLLLLGAGLGIAPIRALLEELPDVLDVVVIQRASTASDAVLHDELRELVAHRGRTTLHLVTGARGEPDDPGRPLGPDHLGRLVPDLADREVFLCGPPGLTADVLRTLTELRVPQSLVHHESFVL